MYTGASSMYDDALYKQTYLHTAHTLTQSLPKSHTIEGYS